MTITAPDKNNYKKQYFNSRLKQLKQLVDSLPNLQVLALNIPSQVAGIMDFRELDGFSIFGNPIEDSDQTKIILKREVTKPAIASSSSYPSSSAVSVASLLRE